MKAASRQGRSSKAILLASILAIAALASMSAPATAGPVLWSGFGSNDLGRGTVLFSVNNGRAKLKSLQVIMSCTDTSDGTDSDRAFDVVNGPTDTLNQNRFNFNFSRSSGGRTGRLSLTGRLRSNGNGSARLDMTATGRDDSTGGVIERCQASLNYRMHRGRAS